MSNGVCAPWHRRSYDRFLHETLSKLLAERLPLADYSAERTGEYACRVRLSVGLPDPVPLTFDLPACDARGLFDLDGQRIVVVPVASCNELDRSEVRCVGEQLYDHVAAQLGEAPPDLPWDEPLARAWLPVDRWVGEFLSGRSAAVRIFARPVVPGYVSTAQPLDGRNWLSRQAHLRRIAAPGPGDDPRQCICPEQRGRTCPFETPEGRNIGRILSIAAGAEIRDGRMVVVDDSPLGALGLTARMVPCLAHSDANRVLMGVNMMRQWIVPPQAEPAVVRTGLEPDAAEFWCGRNLLTAFVSWGGETYEDAIVVSKSGAAKLDFPRPLEPGDKLSNRHGTKGVVGRILPDVEMPHLPDGTAVEVCFSFIGCHARLNFGQIREAVLGRIAHAEDQPIVAPPFEAPDDEALRARLRAAGLPESGMETLTAGRDGPPLDRPSTVGWVYWGKTHHLAADKLHFCTAPGQGHPQLQRELEYRQLRDAGAYEVIRDTFNTRSPHRPDAETLADRAAAGEVPSAEPPTPSFAELQHRLAAAGIAASFDGSQVAFAWAMPSGKRLDLAEPVRHPWLPERALECLGVLPDIGDYEPLRQANERLGRLKRAGAPDSLRSRAAADLAAATEALLGALLTEETGRGPDVLSLGGGVLFSGRTVIAPGPELTLEQLGLPDEIAWALFGPLAARRVGLAEVEARSRPAAEALAAAMAESWVLLNRAPSLLPTSILAFRPTRVPGRAIRLPLLACALLNADFDGDQAAVFLPLSPAANREAGETLSVAAHLRRDPRWVRRIVPSHAAFWGLAERSRTPAGRDEIDSLAGCPVPAPDGIVTRHDGGGFAPAACPGRCRGRPPGRPAAAGPRPSDRAAVGRVDQPVPRRIARAPAGAGFRRPAGVDGLPGSGGRSHRRPARLRLARHGAPTARRPVRGAGVDGPAHDPRRRRRRRGDRRRPPAGGGSPLLRPRLSAR